jgi:hypothetical protein
VLELVLVPVEARRRTPAPAPAPAPVPAPAAAPATPLRTFCRPAAELDPGREEIPEFAEFPGLCAVLDPGRCRVPPYGAGEDVASRVNGGTGPSAAEPGACADAGLAEDDEGREMRCGEVSADGGPGLLALRADATREGREGARDAGVAGDVGGADSGDAGRMGGSSWWSPAELGWAESSCMFSTSTSGDVAEGNVGGR